MNRSEELGFLLDRFFWRDRDLYLLGTTLRIDWFSRFKEKFERDRYAYFTSEEKVEAKRNVTNEASDEDLISAANSVQLPTSLDVDRFVGERYYFDRSVGFQLSDRRGELRTRTKDALDQTGNTGFAFLKAIIDLYRKGMWDNAYGGATWANILAAMRDHGGGYPSPRHIVILKSYGLYYKTGSNRYPTHTVPEEMIPTIKEVLDERDLRRKAVVIKSRHAGGNGDD